VYVCDLDHPRLDLLAAHELGHALGARDDLLGEGNVMAPDRETAEASEGRPTALDVEYARGAP